MSNVIEDDGTPRNGMIGVEYRGENVDKLNEAIKENDFTTNIWLTWKQARKLGAHVRKSEQGVDLVRYVTKFIQDPDDPHRNRSAGRSVRNFVVFNLDQIDGLKLPLVRQENSYADL